jgi:LacI family transcriptional regulator
MRDAGIEDWQRYVRVNTHDSESAAGALRELMALDEPPTALFTTNNRITVGALRALRVVANPPALVGFDDFDLADVLRVTVVSHRPEDMGTIGAERILARLSGAGGDVHSDRLPVRLIERGSGERPPRAT